MSIGPFIGIAIGAAINALIGKKAKKNAEKVSDRDYSLLGVCFTVSHPGYRLTSSILSLVLVCGGGLLILLLYYDNIVKEFQAAKTTLDVVDKSIAFFISFFPLVFILIWATLRAIFWRVDVYEDRIVYTSFINRKTAFTFKDITGVKTYRTQTGESVKVYVKGKKMFAADPACENYYVLLSRLESEKVKFA